MLTVYTSDHIPIPLPAGHRFPAEKYQLLRERVTQLSARFPLELLVAPPVTVEQLRRVHTDDYLHAVLHGKLDERAQRVIGFPWSPQLVQRCIVSTGATVAAARVAQASGWAAHLAGGTHHAFADRGSGYCVFNDVAVAIRDLQADGRIARALIVDCDVHQGDGSAALFAADDSVFTLSLHGARNYPLRKMTSDSDVALADGTRDEEYAAALRQALDHAWSQCCPHIVFYLAGADPFRADRFGRMRLSKAGLAARDQMVLDDCRQRDLPLVAVMGGGYAPDLNDVVDIHTKTIELLAVRAPHRKSHP